MTRHRLWALGVVVGLALACVAALPTSAATTKAAALTPTRASPRRCPTGEWPGSHPSTTEPESDGAAFSEVAGPREESLVGMATATRRRSPRRAAL